MTRSATARREQALQQIARKLNDADSFQAGVETVLELVSETIQADAVSVFVRDPDDETGAVFRVSFARKGKAMESGAVSIELGLSGLVMQTGKAVLVDDVAREPRFAGKLDAEFGTRTRALIAAPMRRRDRLNGLIEALREHPQPFDKADLTFLASVGDELAIAVENARLVDRLREDLRERELLLEAARTVSSTLDLDKVLERLLSTLAELVPYDAVGVYLFDDETGALTDIEHRGYPEDVVGLLSERPGRGITGWAATHRQSVNVGRVHDDSRYVEARPTTQSEVAVPIVRADDVIGVITVESDEADAYTSRQVALLELFANHVASAITNARLHQQEVRRRHVDHELDLAREIQRAALPARELVRGPVEAFGVNVASDVVGGDYFDYFWADDKRLALVLADVSGHGLSASLLMSAVRGAVHLNARTASSTATFCTQLGAMLYQWTPANQFVAFVIGLLDTDNGVLRYTNGGHVPPLRIGADGVEQFETSGLILGALPESQYVENRIQLERGDLLAFYTDGVTETHNASGEEFGTQRLAETIRRHRHKPLPTIVKQVRRRVREFRAGSREDDVTLMLARWALDVAAPHEEK